MHLISLVKAPKCVFSMIEINLNTKIHGKLWLKVEFIPPKQPNPVKVLVEYYRIMVITISTEP